MQIVSGSFSITYPLKTRGRINICILHIASAGIEPGLPSQQASALSITPLPYGFGFEIKIVKIMRICSTLRQRL